MSPGIAPLTDASTPEPDAGSRDASLDPPDADVQTPDAALADSGTDAAIRKSCPTFVP
ncbi:MAG TPA: hypothetical protein VK509_08140 [Polyangiales bacterium]|nr:hypothetical protein [Polyangiales bacterium]